MPTTSIVGFQSKTEAEAFLAALRERLACFGWNSSG